MYFRHVSFQKMVIKDCQNLLSVKYCYLFYVEATSNLENQILPHNYYSIKMGRKKLSTKIQTKTCYLSVKKLTELSTGFT